MRPLYAIVLLVAATPSVPAALAAQGASSAEPAPRAVAISERSPGMAVALEVFLPTAGYAYAGSWARGIPSGIVRVVGIALLTDQIAASPLGGTAECHDRCVVGQILYLGGTLWAAVDAHRTARRNNERARSRALGLYLVPSPSGGVGVALRVAAPF